MMSNAATQTERSPQRQSDPANRNKLLSQARTSSTGHFIFPTITQSFLHWVYTAPQRETFFFKDSDHYQGVTWIEYYRQVEAIALGLQELGIQPGDKVSILSNTRIEWAASDMAILACRAITVPIYASNIAEDCQYILDHCEAKIIFVEDIKQLEKVLHIKDKLKNLQTIVVFSPAATRDYADKKEILSFAALRELGNRALERDPQRKQKIESNLASTKPSDVFTICYTSGTTGVPKGVVLTFDSLASITEDADAVIGSIVNEEDSLVSFLPLSHIFGKVESMMTYHFGWRVYYAESIEKVLVNLAEAKPTLLFAVPRIFEKAYNRIIAAGDEGSAVKRQLFHWAVGVGRRYYEHLWDHKIPPTLLAAQFVVAKKLVLDKVYQRFGGRLRFAVAGGAPLPLEVARFMQVVGITILEGYGLTETCAPVTLNTPDALVFGTIGKPLPEVALKIGDDGEILVKSRKVFKEYYRNLEATNEALCEGWFRTGDIGVIDPSGFVKITDRKKDLLVTSGGKNIAPQKIENLLKTASKYLSQVMVVGDRRNFIGALIVLERDEVVKFAKENHILFSEYKELVKHPKIQTLIQDAINRTNTHLANYESIKRFTIMPQDFTIETGELTPSLKVKRKFCTQKFKSEIDDLYGGEAL